MIRLFLSHASTDIGPARVLATLVERLSLKQIRVWFSGDPLAAGGLRPGDRWLETIRKQLSKSKFVLVLVTKNSIGRPWVYFESGVGAAATELEVVPVGLGISAGEIPLPLSIYQGFELTDYRHATAFLNKLFEKVGIQFDEEMAQPIIKSSIRLLHAAIADERRDAAQAMPPSSIAGEVDRLVSHLDRRFLDLAAALDERVPRNERLDWTPPTYEVSVSLPRRGSVVTESVSIEPDTTIHQVLETVWFMMDRQVAPYSYLISWILREAKSESRLVAHEIVLRLPAAPVFVPGSKWTVELLPKPYIARKPAQAFGGRGWGKIPEGHGDL